ncbi:MAG: GatB/YqeY domain-containing protein [Chitinophagaceae bacterium]|nr:GatB/YqeY domain-containing protein [Chitinophagaceae bacterium]
MNLKNKIDAEIKTSMLQKNQERLRALRSIKSLILLAETEKGNKIEIDEATEISLLSKASKQRKDSLTIYKEQGREDLAKKEQDELDVIHEFLPSQLSEEEIKKEIQNIITTIGAKTPQEAGKVIGVAMKNLAGKADGKIISTIVKKLLP